MNRKKRPSKWKAWLAKELPKKWKKFRIEFSEKMREIKDMLVAPSATKAKAILAIVLCFLFVVPIIILFFALSAPTLPSVTNYDCLAMTDCNGKEYVYPKNDFIFLSAAAAFTSAKHTNSPPKWWTDKSPAIGLEFIEDDYAYSYSLYVNPYPLEAYLTDISGKGYLLNNDAAALLVGTPAAGPGLSGALPPNITVNGESVGFSVCEWTFYIMPDMGGIFTVSSGEYLSESPDPHPIAVEQFACSFAEQPKSLRFRIYRGEEQLLDTIAPDFSTLPSGEYQLVVVAEFDRDFETVRAGYSFSFMVP